MLWIIISILLLITAIQLVQFATYIDKNLSKLFLSIMMFVFGITFSILMIVSFAQYQEVSNQTEKLDREIKRRMEEVDRKLQLWK